MSKSRQLANLLDTSGDVKIGSLDNVPASDNASSLTTGTIPNARIVNLPNAQVAGLAASATIDTTDGSNITSGTVGLARLPEAAKNSNVDLTTLSASNLTSGTVSTARLGSGTAGSGNYLRGDGTWTTNCTNHGNCTTNGNGMANCSNCSGTGNGTITGGTGTAGDWAAQCNGGSNHHKLGTSGVNVTLSTGVCWSVCDCACNC